MNGQDVSTWYKGHWHIEVNNRLGATTLRNHRFKDHKVVVWGESFFYRLLVDEKIGCLGPGPGWRLGSLARGVSRPTPRLEIGGSGWGVSGPTPRVEVWVSGWGGGCIPACTEADTPSPPSRRLLLLLECILVDDRFCRSTGNPVDSTNLAGD